MDLESLQFEKASLVDAHAGIMDQMIDINAEIARLQDQRRELQIVLKKTESDMAKLDEQIEEADPFKPERNVKRHTKRRGSGPRSGALPYRRSGRGKLRCPHCKQMQPDGHAPSAPCTFCNFDASKE